MKFLTDENIGINVVKFLRSRYNVLSVVEEQNLRGVEDNFLISLANKEKRIIITLDKDFGELVFQKLKKSFGIILLRLNNERENNVIKVLSQLLTLKQNFAGKFILVSEDNIRIRAIK